MTSNASGTSPSERNDAADWLYFGSPESEPVADPYAEGVSQEPFDTALIQPVSQEQSPDETTTVSLESEDPVKAAHIPRQNGSPMDATAPIPPPPATPQTQPTAPTVQFPAATDIQQTQPIATVNAPRSAATPDLPEEPPWEPVQAPTRRTPASPAEPQPAPPPKPRRPPLSREGRDAMLRDLLGRGARRLAAMAVLGIALTVLSGQSPTATPLVLGSIVLAVVTLGSEVGGWFAVGCPTQRPVLPPTRISWLAGLLCLALTYGSQGGGAPVWLATFAFGYVGGTAVQVGMHWLPCHSSRPVLPSAPLTVGLSLMTLGLVPTVQTLLSQAIVPINQQVLPWVSWVIPPKPWPWSALVTWLLALVTAAFLGRGPTLAQAPIRWKAPIFGVALTLIVWAFLAHPTQTLVFALAAIVMGVLSLGRR